jgi:hypothetical protein
MFRQSLLAVMVVGGFVTPARAQEPPYFVTYDHYLEEPGNLELAFLSTSGLPKAGHASYTAPWLEMEYGVTGWWTTELYLEGVTTRGDGSGFTGWRLEHRFRPLKSEHRINPVLYFEYENVSEASRIQKEVVGSGSIAFEPIADLRRETARELEAKLILSSVVGPWNVSENVVVEKNLSENEGYEYGYSLGAARSLGSIASGTSCRICRESFTVGIELYGGVGSSVDFGTADTRHYLAPVVGWQVSPHSTIKASPAFGLTAASDRFLFRIGWEYELTTRRAR